MPRAKPLASHAAPARLPAPQPRPNRPPSSSSTASAVTAIEARPAAVDARGVRRGDGRQGSDVAEKMIRKLRAGMMPPAGAKRPEPAVLDGLAQGLETRIDRAAVAQSDARLAAVPAAQSRRVRARGQGSARRRRGRHRAPAAPTPSATASTTSPTRRRSRRRSSPAICAPPARSRRSRSATPNAVPTESAYRVPKTASQLRRVDGAPLGTRGGISVVHTFPADGDYVFRMELHSQRLRRAVRRADDRREDRSVDRRRARRAARHRLRA